MNRKIVFTTMLLVSLVLALATASRAEDRDGVINSMKERYPVLLQAKDQGLIGETLDGFVGVLSRDAPEEVRAIVTAENSDRHMLFMIVARDTSTTIEEVARQNVIRMYRLAEENHYLQDQNRQWFRKGDLL